MSGSIEMAVIAFFTNNGADTSSSTAATDYVYGRYCALTDTQKLEYQHLTVQLHQTQQSSDSELFRELLSQREKIKGRLREPSPQALTSNRRQVEYAISVTPHKYKYSSGVIAHTSEDTAKLMENPQVEREFRQLFEGLVFAGLPESDHLIDWTRHTHEENIENHFIVPRINLRTGKYFNPHPPGSESDFNAIRDYLNYKYQLADPNDPARQNTHKKVGRYDSNRVLKQTLYDEVDKLVAAGICSNRKQIIDWLKGSNVQKHYGFANVQIKVGYIRVIPKGKQKSIRLKGNFFNETFRNTDIFRTKNSEYKQNARRGREERLMEFRDEVERRIAKRAAFNLQRYAEPSKGNDRRIERHKRADVESARTGETATVQRQTSQATGITEAQTSTQRQSSSSTHKEMQESAKMDKSIGSDMRDNSSTTGDSVSVMPELDENMPTWQKLVIIKARKELQNKKKIESQRRDNDKLLKDIQRLVESILDYFQGYEYDLHRTTITRIGQKYATKPRRTTDELRASARKTGELIQRRSETDYQRISARKSELTDATETISQVDDAGLPGLTEAAQSAFTRYQWLYGLNQEFSAAGDETSSAIRDISERNRALCQRVDSAFRRITTKYVRLQSIVAKRNAVQIVDNTRQHEQALLEYDKLETTELDCNL